MADGVCRPPHHPRPPRPYEIKLGADRADGALGGERRILPPCAFWKSNYQTSSEVRLSRVTFLVVVGRQVDRSGVSFPLFTRKNIAAVSGHLPQLK